MPGDSQDRPGIAVAEQDTTIERPPPRGRAVHLRNFVRVGIDQYGCAIYQRARVRLQRPCGRREHRPGGRRSTSSRRSVRRAAGDSDPDGEPEPGPGARLVPQEFVSENAYRLISEHDFGPEASNVRRLGVVHQVGPFRVTDPITPARRQWWAEQALRGQGRCPACGRPLVRLADGRWICGNALCTWQGVEGRRAA